MRIYETSDKLRGRIRVFTAHRIVASDYYMIHTIRLLHSLPERKSRDFYPKIFNPIALRKAKIVYNFGLSECKRVNIARSAGSMLSYLPISECKST